VRAWNEEIMRVDPRMAHWRLLVAAPFLLAVPAPAGLFDATGPIAWSGAQNALPEEGISLIDDRPGFRRSE
jgi:hypothetical protein